MKILKHFGPLAVLLFSALSCREANGDLSPFTIILGAVIAFVLIFIWIFIEIFRSRARHQKGIESAVADRKDFTESKVIKEKGYYYLATDEKRKKVFYVRGTELTLLFDYADVVSVEVSVDGGAVVLRKSLAGAFAGAVAGDLIIGGKSGSFIGALAAGNKVEKRINTIVVHVLLRNQPVQAIDFRCYAGGELNEPEVSYYVRHKEAVARAQELYDLFRLIIDTTAQERAAGTSAVQDLKELASLHDSGALTDEEFEQLKAKIIGKQ